MLVMQVTEDSGWSIRCCDGRTIRNTFGLLVLCATLLLFYVSTSAEWIHKPKLKLAYSTTAPQTSSRSFFATTKVASMEDDEICQNLLYGGNTSDAKDRNPDVTSDVDVLGVMKQGCGSFKRKFSFAINEDPTYISRKERNYPIAYSLLVHQQANQLAHLLSAIYAPQNIYCVHVDRKSSEKFKDAVRAMIDCLPNVFVSSRSEDVVYASFSRLQADINCMDDLLNSKVRWRYLINLCGQDYPLYTNREIVDQLVILNDTNVIRHTVPDMSDRKRTQYVYKIVNKTDRYGKVLRQIVFTYQKKSPPPFNLNVSKNNAYNVYTRRFLKWVIRNSAKAKSLLEWSRDTLTPDEHFWSTAESLPNAPDKTKAGGSRSLARYITWKGTNRPCQGYWKHYSCVFGAGDVADMKNAHLFFANKFDPTFDVRPTLCLRKWLDQRKKRYDQRNPDKKPVVL